MNNSVVRMDLENIPKIPSPPVKGESNRVKWRVDSPKVSWFLEWH
jgi:hypothetical protein